MIAPSGKAQCTVIHPSWCSWSGHLREPLFPLPFLRLSSMFFFPFLAWAENFVAPQTRVLVSQPPVCRETGTGGQRETHMIDGILCTFSQSSFRSRTLHSYIYLNILSRYLISRLSTYLVWFLFSSYKIRKASVFMIRGVP